MKRSIELLEVDALKPAIRNPKDHDLGELMTSIERFGFVDAVVLDERSGRLVAGHGRVEALQAMKKDGKPVPRGVTVDDDGRWLLPVQRGWSSRDDREAEAFIVASNRLVEVGGWDSNALTDLLADLARSGADALSGIGYDADDLQRLIGERAAAAVVPLIDRDDVPAAAPAVAQLGDVWVLGNHRLMCGDSTKAEHVERLLSGARPHLMVTDPPYGVEYDPEWRNETDRRNGRPYRAIAVGPVTNDDRADWFDAFALFPGEVIYSWHPPGANSITFFHSIERAGFDVRMQIIWAKNVAPIGRGHYHVKHEPCWYAVRREGGTGHWQGDRTQTTLWEIDKPRKSESGHSTQKPVECMARPIRNNSAPGDSVYEPFSGSGTTIIACEELGRRCFAMELHPPYVDLAVTRWEAFTGRKAERLPAPG